MKLKTTDLLITNIEDHTNYINNYKSSKTAIFGWLFFFIILYNFSQLSSMKNKILAVMFLLPLTIAVMAQFPTPQRYQYKTVENIKYYNPNEKAYNNEICVLDVYYPTDKKDFQTLIWYHGGGLTGGRNEIPETLKNNGFAIVGVGYRLSPEVTVAECIEDAAAAAAWVVNHISEYGGDKSSIFVSGHSAGGYLTSMIGLDKKYMAKYNMDPDEVFAALIPFSGQAITHFTRRSEMGMKETEPLIDNMAPLYHVRPGSLPILILSGDRELEMTGRYEENAYYWRMLNLVGHKNVEIYEFDGFNHNTMTQPGYQITISYLRKRENEKQREQK